MVEASSTSSHANRLGLSSLGVVGGAGWEEKLSRWRGLGLAILKADEGDWGGGEEAKMG